MVDGIYSLAKSVRLQVSNSCYIADTAPLKNMLKGIEPSPSSSVLRRYGLVWVSKQHFDSSDSSFEFGWIKIMYKGRI